ncbi:hypothetical protein EJV47_16235 [Hymenobacter gummosus]|uniref:Uncharacterized protein n=1 Tax=Hymenobacter gummosus TaxID=1776032 RepID=A0A3S0IM82_9BACT|nr:hypothetical protein [Hymenobacter gummosus]RTQ48519.1 hypothetical protein EJV47_16235 [Hymenobacter gummosus]
MNRLLILSLFWLLSTEAMCAPPGVLLVQLKPYVGTIMVTRGVGKTETIQQKPNIPKHEQENIEQLHTLFAKLYSEGFVLQNSATSGSVTLHTEIVTYVFVKP